jgi:hypothetical protein
MIYPPLTSAELPLHFSPTPDVWNQSALGLDATYASCAGNRHRPSSTALGTPSMVRLDIALPLEVAIRLMDVAIAPERRRPFRLRATSMSSALQSRSGVRAERLSQKCRSQVPNCPARIAVRGSRRLMASASSSSQLSYRSRSARAVDRCRVHGCLRGRHEPPQHGLQERGGRRRTLRSGEWTRPATRPADLTAAVDPDFGFLELLSGLPVINVARDGGAYRGVAAEDADFRSGRRFRFITVTRVS